MGPRWTYIAGDRPHGRFDCPDGGVLIPAPDAPLHEHLAFVGRVAEQFPHADLAITKLGTDGFQSRVSIGIHRGDADDLSEAAMLAAISAKSAGTGTGRGEGST